jgi:hypothetical protein
VNVYNPSYPGGRDRRIMAPGQPRGNVNETYLKNKLDMVTHISKLSYWGGGK